MRVPPGRALAYALLAVVFGALSYAVGVGSLLGQRAEASVLEAASFSYDPPAPLRLVSVATIIVALTAIGAVALWVHGIARAVLVVLVPAAAIITAQLLKQQLLERPELFELDAINTFPSGHMAVFAVISGSAIWAVSRSWAPVVALLAAMLISVASWQLLQYGWHRPSDLVGALSLGVLAFSLTAVIPTSRRKSTQPPSFVRGVNRIIRVILTFGGFALVCGGLVLTAVAGWLSSAPLYLAAAQIAMLGASVLTARAVLALRD